MMQPQAETLNCIEKLLLQRLECLKSYPVLSISAMNSLEKGDIEGFGKKLDERAAVSAKADELNHEISRLVSQLDESCGAIVERLIKPGLHDAPMESLPQWCAGIARSMERTLKLLHNCALFDAKLLVRAKAVQDEIQKQLSHIRAQKKINASYTGQNSVSQSERTHFTSKQ